KSTNDDTSHLRVKRTLLRNMAYRWTFPIEYDIGYYLNETIIEEAIDVLEKETCITFKRVRNFTGPGLHYVYGFGCQSYIGKVSNYRPQQVSIGYRCDRQTIILHETCHALGMIHEMNRPDRDKYIKFNLNNLNQRHARDFELISSKKSLSFGLKYDYGSVMHYDRIAGSINKQPLMVPREIHYLNTIGQTTEFGFNDVKQLNLYYCSDKCKKKLNCKVGGYPNPHKCNECKCPRFYTGKLCEKLLESDSTCGKIKFHAKSVPQTFSIEGKKSCYIQVVVPERYKVRISVLEATLDYSFICQPNNGLEVKYRADKSVSGAIFCGNVTNGVIVSEKHVVVMRYVGKEANHNVKIKFQRVTPFVD
uniref:Zinc metalloproteinase n=1 Tax=Parastrongyloides trichosuri TaxID=131310 RepID=A0A0N4ZZT7_PARTI